MEALVAIFVPVVVAPLVLALGRRSAAGVALAAVGTSAAAALVAAATAPRIGYAWSPELRLELAVTDLARPFAVAVPLVGLAIVLYATASNPPGRDRSRLLALLTAFVGTMQLLVLAGDLLTLLFAWELVGALSWALISHQWTDATRPERALQAFLTTRLGDLGLYAAAGFTFAATGRLDYAALEQLDGASVHLVAAGLLLAAAAKSAQLPFSPWLASAMAGPTPVSALLHSATLVAAGAYALARLMPGLDGAGWLPATVVAVGLTTAVGMGVVAALERDLKRVLAASTCAQYGLIFTAVGAGSIAAAGGHLLTHAAVKALLFLTAGLALEVARTGDLGRLRLGRALPLVAGAAALGAASLAGLPPLPGAWSKESIVTAAFEFSTPAGLAALLASALTAFYLARWWLLAFGRPAPSSAARTSPTLGPLTLAGPSLLLGLLALLTLGWLSPVQRGFADLLGADVFSVPLSEVLVSLVVLAAGAMTAVLLDRRGALLSAGVPPRLQQAATSWFGLHAGARVLVVDPVLCVAKVYATVDDDVVDGGVRLTGRVATRFSRRLAWWDDKAVDGGVRLTGRIADRFGRGLSWWGEKAVDGVVLGSASTTTRAARLTSALQSGLTHHYYVIVGVGLVVTVAVAALGS